MKLIMRRDSSLYFLSFLMTGTLIAFQNCNRVDFNKMSNTQSKGSATSTTNNPIVVSDDGSRGFCRLKIGQHSVVRPPNSGPALFCPALATYVGFGTITPKDFKIGLGPSNGLPNPTACSQGGSVEVSPIGNTLIPVMNNSSDKLCVTRTECEVIIENYLETPALNPCGWDSFDPGFSRGILLSFHDTTQPPNHSQSATVQFEPNNCTGVETRTYDVVHSEISRLASTRAFFGCESPPRLIDN